MGATLVAPAVSGDWVQPARHPILKLAQPLVTHSKAHESSPIVIFMTPEKRSGAKSPPKGTLSWEIPAPVGKVPPHLSVKTPLKGGTEALYVSGPGNPSGSG